MTYRHHIGWYPLRSRCHLRCVRVLSAGHRGLPSALRACPQANHALRQINNANHFAHLEDKYLVAFGQAGGVNNQSWPQKRKIAHAGEEGPASYVRDALQLLKVERIDHGVRSQDDPALMQYLADHAISLTVCPLSNIKLKVFDSLHQHNLKHLLDRGLNVCVNSDDPAYFGGYLLDNYMQTAQALNLQEADLRTLAANSLRSSFLPKEHKQVWLNKLEHIPGND